MHRKIIFFLFNLVVVYLSTIVSGLHLKVRFFHTQKKICGTRFHIASRRVFKVPIILTFIKILIFLFTGRITTREWMIFFYYFSMPILEANRHSYCSLFFLKILLWVPPEYSMADKKPRRVHVATNRFCKKNEKMKNNSVCLHFLMSVRFDLTIDYISLDIYLLYVLNQHKPFLVFQARLFRLFF